MFGVVPKSIWQKTNPADEQNMCTWAMRCLLIEDADRLILVDTGIGTKQSEKFFSHYYLHGQATLESSLKALGFDRSDITDVFLTHLHFDHCGGAIAMNGQGGYKPYFENAYFWSNDRHWNWATKPNARERASFLSENILPIQQTGQLKMVERNDENNRGNALGFEVYFVDGHTDSMMIPMVKYKDKTICFMADLLPSIGHLPLPYVMGYDTRPLITLGEKEKFLNEAVDNNYILMLEHDSVNECCSLVRTDKGIRADQVFKLAEI
jgi:glyoxylase-like metal-dependent hydrolase (beta-lactamase superfamily II)